MNTLTTPVLHLEINLEEEDVKAGKTYKTSSVDDLLNQFFFNMVDGRTDEIGGCKKETK